MLYFLVNVGTHDVFAAHHSGSGNKARELAGLYGREVVSRWDFKTFDIAKAIAASATKVEGKLYIATDAGPAVSPRYDVIEAPVVGDAVSYAFNGDSYPCGEIVSISKTLKVIRTSEGKVFHRRRESGCWKSGGWSMIAGHHDERNPSF